MSGRPNYVWDEIRGRLALGRFGWKANNPSLGQQTAGAYNGDMGITTSIFPAEACEGADPARARHAPELADETVADVAFYVQTLGVPARRNLDDPTARRGEALFHQTGCASCHVPKPTSWSTTWDRRWPTIGPISGPRVRNGEPRRFGASVWSKRSTATPTSTTTAGPGRCSRRSSGTAVALALTQGARISAVARK